MRRIREAATMKLTVAAALLAAITVLGGCANGGSSGVSGEDRHDPSAEAASQSSSGGASSEFTSGVTLSSQVIPQELDVIPDGYSFPAEQQGTLVELEYGTYESMTYDEGTQELSKRAIVYLPYGYSEDERYNVFYLMHGGWGDETQMLGTPDSPSAFKNVLDNAIAAGEIGPLIVVCPTCNNTSPDDSGDFGLDYFRYFLPMSCGTPLDMDNILAAAEDRDQSDFFVWVITGSEDFAHQYDENRVGLMRSSPYFTEADNEQDGNFAYRVKAGYSHDGMATMEYTYNGLRWFWGA